MDKEDWDFTLTEIKKDMYNLNKQLEKLRRTMEESTVRDDEIVAHQIQSVKEMQGRVQDSIDEASKRKIVANDAN